MLRTPVGGPASAVPGVRPPGLKAHVGHVRSLATRCFGAVHLSHVDRPRFRRRRPRLPFPGGDDDENRQPLDACRPAGLLTRTLRVGENELFTLPTGLPSAATGSVGSLSITAKGGIPLGTQLMVPWRIKLPDPLTASPLTSRPVEQPKPSATPVTLAHVTKNVGIGLGLGGSTMTLMPLAHATTAADLSARLTGYGFAPATSQTIAQQGLDFARSHAGQLTTIFLAGSAVGVGVVEAVRPNWSWTRKILTGSLFGVALLGLATWGIHKGWWGYDAGEKAGAAVQAVKKGPASAP